MNNINKILIFFFTVLFINPAVSQEEKENDDLINWYNNHELGIQTHKAYKKLRRKKSKTVIVAVIDSGVDIEHEDLKGQIWINDKEAGGEKGVDDDKNGYIDDIYGWNFLGNANGENIDATRLEKTRILHELKDKYENVDPKMMEQNAEFKLYIKVKKEVETELTQMKQYQKMYGENPEYSKYFSDQIDFNLNTDYDDRSLIGDDPRDINDRSYGNSDVEGPDALHGTHVAGIIAAVRGNSKGGDGVAKNVKIMTVRAVPNGDEHDKDIALAIRYAVDNGAKIINMSFGKAYSPNQEWVYEALKYADDHDVLLVHAAGNDAQNVDKTDNYPTSKYSFQKEAFKSYLTIGASTPNAKILNASFSNYGKTKVDVFAPGEKIYNTIPDNKYKWLQGTSMAAPVVSGAAAFLASYYPKLSMQDIKEILMSTATKHEGPFSNLSVTGGVINLKCAIKKAKKVSRKK